MMIQSDMEQGSALDFEGGRALFAGIAGTGKTEMLRQRTLRLSQGHDAASVGLLNLSIGDHRGSSDTGFVVFADFCHRFLSEHELLSPAVSRLDEAGKLEIISRLSRLESCGCSLSASCLQGGVSHVETAGTTTCRCVLTHYWFHRGIACPSGCTVSIKSKTRGSRNARLTGACYLGAAPSPPIQ